MLIYPHDISIGPGFSGRVKLFPLPNVTLFPHAVQPLHIFEPRYRDMLASAIAEDGLIAMATLSEGWEGSPLDPPPIESVVGIGRVVAQHLLPDGGSNILLAGVRRARIVRELPQEHRYREARVRVLDDVYLASPVAVSRRSKYRARLLGVISGMLADNKGAKNLKQLLSDDVSLGTLSDICASTMDWPLELRQELLAEPIVDRRARRLLSRIRKRQQQETAEREMARALRPRYPLEFSLN